MPSHSRELLASAALVAGACAPASTPATCGEDPAVRAAIATAWAAHVDGHLRQDAEVAAAVYTDDVWMRWEGGLDLRGREAARAHYANLYGTMRITALAYTSDEVLACGDVAHETGRFDEAYETTEGPATYRGHYKEMWKRGEDGTWRVHQAAGGSLP